MIELYHWEPTTCSGEVLILLEEKGIDFVPRYVNVLAFQQLEPGFLALNPAGQVPVLLHDGQALTETGFILQYLDEVFPTPRLTPDDPQGRYWVNVWIKYVEEYLAPAAARLGLAATAAALAPLKDRAETALLNAPVERRLGWSKALETGYSAEDLEEARGFLTVRLERLEQALAAHGFVAGETYSLADIVVFPTLRALAGLGPGLIGPRASAWLERIAVRPAVQRALAYARTPRPQAVFAPGPEGSRWG